jgi:hypothetical protein
MTDNVNRIEDLINLRKPSGSLIRLIEAIGILLGVPPTKKKSQYKAPIPSNYDATIHLLAHDFYTKLHQIAALESSQISNQQALEFYNKLLEPEFIYEDAINVGGLLIRELFNAILSVLTRLQSDNSRIPTMMNHVLVFMDGNRSSFVALDTAQYACKHGILHICVDNPYLPTDATNNTLSNADLYGNELPVANFFDPNHLQKNLSFLKIDIIRRCQQHYKLTAHQYQLHHRDHVEHSFESHHMSSVHPYVSLHDHFHNTYHNTLAAGGATLLPAASSTQVDGGAGGQDASQEEKLFVDTMRGRGEEEDYIVPLQQSENNGAFRTTSGTAIGGVGGGNNASSTVLNHPVHKTTKYLGEQSIISSLQYLANKHDCRTIVMGIQDTDSAFRHAVTHQKSSAYYWLLHAYPGDVIFTKGISYTRPFTEHNNPRNYLFYFPDTGFANSNPEEHMIYLWKALKYVRPQDTITVVRFFPSSEPVGDNRVDLRFDFGQRQGWLKTPQILANEPNRVGWNDETVDAFQTKLGEYLSKANVSYRLRLERQGIPEEQTIPQRLQQIAFEEDCQSIFFPWQTFLAGNYNESPFTLAQTDLVIDCIRDLPYTLYLVK